MQSPDGVTIDVSGFVDVARYFDTRPALPDATALWAAYPDPALILKGFIAGPVIGLDDGTTSSLALPEGFAMSVLGNSESGSIDIPHSTRFIDIGPGLLQRLPYDVLHHVLGYLVPTHDYGAEGAGFHYKGHSLLSQMDIETPVPRGIHGQTMLAAATSNNALLALASTCKDMYATVADFCDKEHVRWGVLAQSASGPKVAKPRYSRVKGRIARWVYWNRKHCIFCLKKTRRKALLCNRMGCCKECDKQEWPGKIVGAALGGSGVHGTNDGQRREDAEEEYGVSGPVLDHQLVPLRRGIAPAWEVNWYNEEDVKKLTEKLVKEPERCKQTMELVGKVRAAARTWRNRHEIIMFRRRRRELHEAARATGVAPNALANSPAHAFVPPILLRPFNPAHVFMAARRAHALIAVDPALIAMSAYPVLNGMSTFPELTTRSANPTLPVMPTYPARKIMPTTPVQPVMATTPAPTVKM